MKKFTALLLALMLAMSLLAGCSTASTTTTEATPAPEVEVETPVETEAPEVEEEVEEEVQEEVTADPVDMHVMAMSGPTSMGMVYMMNESDNGDLTDNNYSFTIATAIDEVTPQIVSVVPPSPPCLLTWPLPCTTAPRVAYRCWPSTPWVSSTS